ncbi:MAG TPA: hypothetical protein VJ916_03640 [Anaerovoracaceae bacterium]|nr:hypothetical protein [Anaerovoracaceae bacterium]
MKDYFSIVDDESKILITSSGERFELSNDGVRTCYIWDIDDELKISIKDKTITNKDLDETVEILNRYN